MALQFRRGTAAERNAATEIPAAGEPWFTYDDGKLYVGDGTTAGGVSVTGNLEIQDLNNITTINEDVGSLATYSVSSNVATVTLAVDHGYYIGLVVDIADSSVTALNGARTITGIVGTNGFTFALVAADVGSTSVTGTATPRIPDGNALVWDSATTNWVDGVPTMSIDDLSDVDTTAVAPTDGQVLSWDNAASQWEPATPVTALDDLSDVDLTSVAPTAGDLLIYDGTSTNFEPGTISTNDLSDVDTSTTPTNRDVLIYNSTSSNFEAGSPNIDDLADVDTTTATPSDGEALVWSSATSTWVPGSVAPAATQTQFYFLVGTPPTGTVSSSSSVGQNLGTWYEATFANAGLLQSAPASTAGDPNLTGITFNPVTGAFSGFSAGRYIFTYDLSLVVNNPTPGFYTSPPALLVNLICYSTAGDIYLDDDKLPLLPYSSYGSTSAYLTQRGSLNVVFTDTTPANNAATLLIDQNQGTSIYADHATLNITRVADV